MEGEQPQHAELSPDVRRLYTLARLAELVGAPLNVVRRWQQGGLLSPALVVHRLAYFDFADVTIARKLKEWSAGGASTREMKSVLLELKRRAQGHARPLAELPTTLVGKQLLLWQNDELVEISGQRWLNFDPAAPEKNAANNPASVAFALPGAGAATVEELLADAAELEETNQLALAAEALRAALAAGGPRAELCFQLAELLYRQGDLGAARERYYMAIELDEDFVEARANLGCLLAEAGEIELAQAALAGALAFHPDYADAHYHLARLCDDLQQPEAAETHWRRFAELAPESPWRREPVSPP